MKDVKTSRGTTSDKQDAPSSHSTSYKTLINSRETWLNQETLGRHRLQHGMESPLVTGTCTRDTPATRYGEASMSSAAVLPRALSPESKQQDPQTTQREGSQ